MRLQVVSCGDEPTERSLLFTSTRLEEHSGFFKPVILVFYPTKTAFRKLFLPAAAGACFLISAKDSWQWRSDQLGRIKVLLRRWWRTKWS